MFSGVRDADAALCIAERVLSSFEAPFVFSQHEIHSTASIGITLSASKTTTEDLLKQADIAMYKAKNGGKNQICFYDESLEREFFKLFQIERELREAIKTNEFEVYYQPILTSTSNTVKSLEALVRLPVKASGASPAEYIHTSEKTRLIEAFGRLIIQKALCQYAELCHSDFSQSIELAINLSPLQIHDLNLPTFLQQQAKHYKVDLTKVIIEVTETALLENSESTMETLRSIKSKGCKIALDDFGTGFSSISHLLNYPIDIVKFDKSLIERTLQDEKAKIMLIGLASMLHSLSIETVAEGVEFEAHATLCKQAKVSCLQGYYFSKPLSFSDLKATLSKI